MALLLVLGFYPKPVLDMINPAVAHTLTTINQHDPAPTAAPVKTAEGHHK
jgi:NADH-quinone oxidoreductase subunit M